MPDKFVHTTTTGYGSRITGALKGIVIGLLMFVVSFGVLYWNEGRVDMSKVAQDAVEIQSSAAAPAEAVNQLVSTSGTLTVDGQISDTYLQPGNYVAIKRTAEMYAWIEEAKSESQTKLGGSETTTTTYTYIKEWTADPNDSSQFEHSDGHENPQKTVNDNLVVANNAKIGLYQIDLGQADLPAFHDILLNSSNAVPGNGVALASDQYLFKGTGSLMTPQIGDIRISYAVVNPNINATVLGKLMANNSISSFYGPKNTKLFRVFEGTRDDAVSTLSTEHSTMTWILRLIGFLLMWFGLMTLLKPISIFLDVLPILGSISKATVGLATFVISLALSIVTIIISMLFHSLLAIIIVAVIGIGAAAWYLKSKKKKVQPAQ